MKQSFLENKLQCLALCRGWDFLLKKIKQNMVQRYS
jgi:hypothetical protein